MRKKHVRLVAAFYTTAGAIAAESLCLAHGLEGKLISVPRSITSDCGLAWSAPPEVRPELERLLAEAGVETAGIYEMLL